MKINEVVLQKKAGVIPYYIRKNKSGENEILMMFMIPSDFKYGGPNPQIAKGHLDPGEDAAQTALREGEEELGLRSSNIKQSFHVMTADVPSKANAHNLAVYAAEILDPKAFDKPHYETGKVLWLTPEVYEQRGRKNQAVFVAKAAELINSKVIDENS